MPPGTGTGKPGIGGKVDNLSDTQIRKAKPAEKAYRLADGGGLHVYVTPQGSKLWRYRYEFGGKEKLLSIGPFPEISLSDAREARRAARADLREGRDPGITKKFKKLARADAAGKTFELVAREWHEKTKGTWSENHARDVLSSLTKNAFPMLGNVPIVDITAPMVLEILRSVEERNAAHIAHRLRQRMSAVFVYGIASGLNSLDPAGTVAGALVPLERGKQPAARTLKEARKILQDVESERASPITKLAHRLLALTVVRPGTLATTPWTEFGAIDPENPIWTVPATRMKLRKAQKGNEDRDHLVPLSKQALEVIEAIRQLTSHSPFAFPNQRTPRKAISENAIGYLLNRAGYHGHHVPHGWRAAFSTIMNEAYRADRQIIDLMLAHVPKEKVEGAYNRALHIERRKDLAQLWADMLLEGMPSAEALLLGPRQ